MLSSAKPYRLALVPFTFSSSAAALTLTAIRDRPVVRPRTVLNRKSRFIVLLSIHCRYRLVHVVFIKEAQGYSGALPSGVSNRKSTRLNSSHVRISYAV